MLRALIVEDEPYAAKRLQDLLTAVDWIRCEGVATDGPSALREIDATKPDLLFLDVRLPGLDGIQVLQRVAHRPAVVFTTAFDEFAVTAFELDAVDYLTKPFGKRRFDKTMARVRERFAPADASGSPPRQLPLRRLFLRKGSDLVQVRAEAIARVQARDGYTEVFTDDGATYLLELPLSRLAERLDSARFLRVHRSHLVNMDRVSSLTPHDERRLLVRMSDGAELIASRVGSQRLREIAGHTTG